MKGPTSGLSYDGMRTLRAFKAVLRIILGKFTFQEYGNHVFRAKNVEFEDRAFHLDCIEYIPVSAIEKEGKD